VTLSVVLITHNEEANLARTLESVRLLVRDRQGEIIVVDSGSTDRTVETAKSFGARFSWRSGKVMQDKRIQRLRKPQGTGF